MTKITAEAPALGKALREVAAIVNRADTIPILSHVLIEADASGSVRLTATDTLKRVERTIQATVEDAGAFTVEAARFAAVVASYNGNVTIATEDGGAVVKSGRSRIRFGTLNAADFPPMPFGEVEASFVGGPDFVSALNRTRHAHGTSEVQSMLMGALLTDRGGLEVVALDANRMAIVNLGVTGVPAVIVPSATVDLVTKLASGSFDVAVAKDRIRFTFGATTVTSKLIDGNYPKYEHIIPRDQPRHAKVDADAMREALVRIALVADDRDRKVRLRFAGEAMTIALDANTDQAWEEVPCAYVGDPFEIAFRSGYLRDALTAIDADEVTLGMDKPMSPMMMTADQAEGMTIIVMPISF